MVDGPCLGEGPHFFIVMLLFGKNPFEMRDTLAPLDLLPYFSIKKDLPY